MKNATGELTLHHQKIDLESNWGIAAKLVLTFPGDPEKEPHVSTVETKYPWDGHDLGDEGRNALVIMGIDLSKWDVSYHDGENTGRDPGWAVFDLISKGQSDTF